MNRRSVAARCAAFGFAVALVLKAAVPMLAAGAAAWQGKAVAEVCSVWGVATVAPRGDGGRDAHDPGAHDLAAHAAHAVHAAHASTPDDAPPSHDKPHDGDRCALAALAALAAGAASGSSSLAAGRPVVGGDPASISSPRRDAEARWAAALAHAPPLLFFA